MEDAIVRQYCQEVSRQILVPSRSYTPLLASSTVRPQRVGGTASLPTPSSSSANATVAPGARARSSTDDASHGLHRAADAVAMHAMTLYRLCKSPQNAIVMAPAASSSGGGLGAGGGGGGGGVAGSGSGLSDAVFCVCARLAALQPKVWESLRWRAAVLRARSPRLLLGNAPQPTPYRLKDLEQFISRSARVLTSSPSYAGRGANSYLSTHRPAMARTSSLTSPSPAAAATSANPAADSVTQARPPHASALTAALAAESVLDEVQAESIAACYFLSVSTPEERKRFPHVFQVAPEAVQRRRDRLRMERTRQQQPPGELSPATGASGPSTPRSRKRPRQLALEEREAPPPRFPKATQAPAVLTGGSVPAVLLPGAPLTSSRGGATATFFLEEEQEDGGDASSSASGDSADDVEDGDSGTERNAGATADEEDSTADGGGRRRAKLKRRRRVKHDARGKAEAADPEVLWARLYAVALGNGEDLASDTDSDGELANAAQGTGRRLGRVATTDDAAPLFVSAKRVHLVELAAQTEVVRQQLLWRRLETCLANPLLYHYELLTRTPSVSTLAAAKGDAEGVALHQLFGSLGSSYTSQCVLEYVMSPSPPASAPSTAVSLLPLSPPPPSAPLALSCHPAHYLHPSRPESRIPSVLFPSPTRGHAAAAAAATVPMAPSLLGGPTSLVTAPFLWRRLLICAVWITAYADYVLPLAIEQPGDATPAATAERPSQPSSSSASKGSSARARLARQLLSPHLASTLAFCVATVKEARQYAAICCPVCDSLSAAVAHQQAQWRRTCSTASPPSTTAAAADEPASYKDGSNHPPMFPVIPTAPVVQWGALREDRKALARSMQPFLALTQQEEEEEKESAAPSCEDVRGDPTTAAAAAARLASSSAEEDAEDYALSLDATGRQLRRRWQRFAHAHCWSDALRAFSSTSVANRRTGTEGPSGDGGAEEPGAVPEDHKEAAKEAPKGTTAVPPITPEQRARFIEALSRRLHPLVDLLSGTIVTSGAACSAAGPVSCAWDASSPHQSGSAHARMPQSSVLRHAAWMLNGLGVLQPSRTEAAPDAGRRKSERERRHGAVTGLPSLQRLSLRELVKTVLLSGQRAEWWGPLLLPLLPLPFPPQATTERLATPEDPLADGSGAPTSHAAVTTTVTAATAAAAAPVKETASRGRQRRRLKAQRRALHALLDFVPFVPALVEGDAVVECAHCFSLFHQTCVGPIQSDFASGLFLCHTCRLKHGDCAGLEVRPFA